MIPWLATNAGGCLRFRAALADPEKTQRAILLRYLQENAGTAFGQQHRFAEIRTVQQFQERVPMATYADFAPWIERIASGEPGVLTRSHVRTLELTSGSSAAAKRIPYTAAMQREIRRAVAPWVFDLYKDRPRLAMGCAYWSITPIAMDEERAEGPVKVGFEEDSEYLGGFWKRLVDSTLAVPGSVRFARDVDSFRYSTLRHLLRRRDLTVISVWHPSFLTLLMGALPRFWDDLVRDSERGGRRNCVRIGPDELTPDLAPAGAHQLLGGWPRGASPGRDTPSVPGRGDPAEGIAGDGRVRDDPLPGRLAGRDPVPFL